MRSFTRAFNDHKVKLYADLSVGIFRITPLESVS